MTGVNQNTVASVLFSLVALLIGADLLADVGSGAGLAHVGLEGAGAAVALVGAVWFFRQYVDEQRMTRRWRDRAEELLAGVGHTIDEQFAEWGLTKAEGEVALLLLKGLSFKEVASVRETGERTAREQARSVYKKAGIAGRAELSAWFIEDLLPENPG